MELGVGTVALIAITLFAAFVNGALGYGFSSITVPVALLFHSNRLLNPALVVVEVFINLYVLFLNRSAIPAVWKRVLPILLGLAPGIALGSYLIASLHPAWLKLGTYGMLLPLILVQAAGLRRPIKSERLFGVPFGAGLGFLYSVTTISGPPMAVLFNNQGFVKKDFRAGLALIRVGESVLTAIAYWHLGLFVAESQSILLAILPSVIIGIPLGAYIIRKLDAETFRRVCMSFDVWVVGFGFGRVLLELKLAQGGAAYGPMLAAGLLDIYLLYYFFRSRGRPALAAA
ncbi:MAG TPA: sulfite exporter TauE/SafE family protein [Burkholderiales bacterium]|jgi:hypothetical protein